MDENIEICSVYTEGYGNGIWWMEYFETLYAWIKISRYIMYVSKVMETIFGGLTILRCYMDG